MSPERMSAEQGERCQLCGSLVEVVSSDEGTLCYRPMSAEQGDVRCKARRYHPFTHDYYIVCDRPSGHEGEHHMIDCCWADDSKYALPSLEPVAEQRDVETIREALDELPIAHVGFDEAPAHVALDRLSAALERAERERDHWKLEARGLASEQRVAEKAEQERDTYKQDYLTRHERWRDAEARAEKAERALAEIRENALSWHGPLSDTGHERALAVIATWADAALRPSEKASDES